MKVQDNKKKLFVNTFLELSKEAVICYNIKNERIFKSNKLANDLYDYSEASFASLYLSDICENCTLQDFKEETKEYYLQKKKNGDLFKAEIQVSELDEDYGILIIKNTEEENSNYQNYKNLYQRLEETNQIVRQVDEISSSKIGEEYFQSIVNALSKILEADYVFITEEHAETKMGQTLYSSSNGAKASNIEYELAGTPCENTLSNNICVYTKNVQELFPADLLLVEMGIAAYAGVSISIRNMDANTSRWILVALFSKELKDKDFFEHILILFAQKIQAERERFNLLNLIKESANDSKKFRDIILKLTLDQDLIQGNKGSFFSKATEQLADVLRTKRVGIWLFENNNKELACIDLYETNSRGHKKGDRITAKEYPRYFRAILDEHCIYANDACTDLRTIEFKEKYLNQLGIVSMLDVGILVRGQLVGLLCVEHVGKQRNWTADEITFVNTISSLLANTIINNEYIRLNQSYEVQNQRFKELLEVNEEAEIAANFGTWKWSIKDNYILWSDNMCRIHGIEPQQFSGKFDDVINFIHPEDRNLLLDKIQKIMVTKIAGTLEYRIQTLQGETKYVEGATRVYLDENQNISVMWGSLRDITEQKQKELELLESQVKYKDLFDNIIDGMCVLDAKGNILHYNKAFSKILGYEEEELKTLKIPDIVHPDQYELSEQQFVKLSKDGSYEGYESKIIQKNGSIIWVQVNSTAIYDKDGNFIGSNDIIRDVTERKKAEADLLKKNAEIRERVKELNCLYLLSDLVNKSKITVEEILDEFIEFLPAAYQYPEITCARITYNDLILKTKSFKESNWKQESYIKSDNVIIGKIEVFYTEERKEEDEGPFMKEERFLINTLVDILSNTVDRKKSEIELQKIREVLEETSSVARVGGWDMDLNTRELYWTDVARAIHEIPSDYDINNIKSSDFIKNEADLKRAIEATQKTIKTGEPYDLEVGINTFKGNSIWIRTIGKGEFKDGKCVRLYGAIQDITERKKAEIELQKIREVLEETSRVAKVGGWEVDVINQKAYWTDVTREIHEIPLDYDLNLLKSTDFVKNEAHAKQALEATQRIMETGEPYELELEIVTAKGNPVWVKMIGKSEFKDNKCVRLYGAIQDITRRKKAEIELRKTREILEETSQIARVGGWEMDLINQKFYWTDVVKEIHEVPMDYEPQLGATSSFLKEGILKEKAIEASVKARTIGEPYDIEFEIITAKGNEVWVRTIGKTEMKDGQCVRVYGAMQDITKRKKLEQELAKANETEFAKLYHQQKIYTDQIQQKSKELDSFFELSLDLICIVDKNGIAQRLNPAFIKTLGYSEKELLSKPLGNFRVSEDNEKTIKAVEKMIQGRGMLGFENRYITKDGRIRTLSWHAVQDPNKELTYAIARDITEDKKASKQIEDLKYTLDQTAIVMVVGRDWKIISVNDKFCEISGYSKEEVIGENHGILDSNYHSKSFWTNLFSTIESGKMWQGEIKERAKNGSFYWTSTSCVPFFDEYGEISQYIVIQADITARKQLEIDLRKAEEEAIKNAKIKEDFLANMSHEIRTPMNAVLGFSRLLLQTNLQKKQYDYAHAIYTSAENLLVIVNDILDFSKMESGKLELERIAFNFKKMILAAVNTLKISIENKNIDFVLEIDPKIPESIVSTPNRITQILINLIGNAIKFTNKGYIKLKISLKEPKILLFEVEDTGIGIAEDKLDFIFQSFTQAESYTTRIYGGTGLGLSISQKLVGLMGGQIAVKSQLGKGSTFFFTLPFNIAEDFEITNQAQESKQITYLKGNNSRLLIVDDNQLNRQLVSIYLNMLQCVFDEATNGQEALQFVAKNKYDLILMDIQMPVMDGIEATIIIRQQDKKTPIIAMTAHALQKEKQKCFEIGMNDYLSKPFKKEDLEEILIKHIGQVEVVETHKEKNKKKAALISSDDVFLDMEHLKDEVGDNIEMVRHVLHLFKEEVIQFLESMQKAIGSEDINLIGQIAHKIKPNFQLFQLDFLTKILEEIERLSAEGEGQVIYERCKEVLRYIPVIQLRVAEELLATDI